MQTSSLHPRGLWLPLVTPFRDGAFDAISAQRLARYIIGEAADGLILGATTGEGMTVDDGEIQRYVALCRGAMEEAGRHIPLFLGVSGSDTREVIATLARIASWEVDGTLIACPYYTRPSQLGLFRHFTALADAATKPIMIYNIPYRTGVNLGNETMLRLAEHPNIVGLKDCCANPAQSFDLLRQRPPNFAVLTGEDALFFDALAQGADGGIVASAHVAPADFAAVLSEMRAGKQAAALTRWRALVDLPRLLFAEPSPAPIKHWLQRVGLIDSAEVRLPMTEVSDDLAARLDAAIAERTATERSARAAVLQRA